MSSYTPSSAAREKLCSFGEDHVSDAGSAAASEAKMTVSQGKRSAKGHHDAYHGNPCTARCTLHQRKQCRRTSPGSEAESARPKGQDPRESSDRGAVCHSHRNVTSCDTSSQKNGGYSRTDAYTFFRLQGLLVWMRPQGEEHQVSSSLLALRNALHALVQGDEKCASVEAYTCVFCFVGLFCRLLTLVSRQLPRTCNNSNKIS